MIILKRARLMDDAQLSKSLDFKIFLSKKEAAE